MLVKCCRQRGVVLNLEWTGIGKLGKTSILLEILSVTANRGHFVITVCIYKLSATSEELNKEIFVHKCMSLKCVDNTLGDSRKLRHNCLQVVYGMRTERVK